MRCEHCHLQIGLFAALRLITLCLGYLVTLSLMGCDTDEEQGSTSESSFEVPLDEGDVAVATVDGVPITKRRVVHLAEETGRPPREVVERLIEFELLAAEARRRGLAADREVLHTVRQAMIQRYLEKEFEETRRVADVPDDVVEKAYVQNIGRFKHPRLRKVAHILVIAREQRDSEARRAKAHRLAGVIAREARKASDVDEFKAIGERFHKTDGFLVKVEVLRNPVYKRARLVRPFIDAAMGLEKAGDMSPPVQTNFGSHIIYLIEVKEAIDRSLEDAHDEVAEREHPHWLQKEFAQCVDTLRLAETVKGYVGEKRRSAQR